MIDVEHMNDLFTKYHLNQHGTQPWPFRPVLHHFKGPDWGDPHDHPWNFTTHILMGSYLEEVYTRLPGGDWSMELVERKAGTAHRIEATHIHRIVALPEGGCWTLVLPEAGQRVPHFWRFNETGVYCRPWTDRDFKLAPLP